MHSSAAASTGTSAGASTSTIGIGSSGVLLVVLVVVVVLVVREKKARSAAGCKEVEAVSKEVKQQGQGRKTCDICRIFLKTHARVDRSIV